MKSTSLFFALMLAAVCNFAAAQESRPSTNPAPVQSGIAPQMPRFEFLYEAHVSLGEQVMSGTYEGHQRGTMNLLGGTFEGPNIKGKILPSTRDWPTYLGNGVRITNVDYTFVTDDGAHLFVSVDGYRYDPSAMKGALLESEKRDPAPNLLRVFIRIKAPDDSRYAWLNTNLFVGVAGTSSTQGTERTATLRVYRVL